MWTTFWNHKSPEEERDGFESTSRRASNQSAPDYPSTSRMARRKSLFQGFEPTPNQMARRESLFQGFEPTPNQMARRESLFQAFEPTPNQRRRVSTGSGNTSRAITLYSEDIPPIEEEDVADMRWTRFVTLVDQRGGQYRQRSSTPAAYGGFSDIWQCDTVFSDGSNLVVAVKKLRAVKLPPGLDKSQTNKKLLGRLKKELQIWMRLQHPNVAPLMGFTFDEEIAIISPWFNHGNVSNYMAAHPEADRMKLVQGVAAGLEHLHSSSPVVVHGDIKPDNVLIDRWGCARIIDFGLSKIVEEDPSLSSLRSASLRDAGNARWIAPELLLEEGTSRSGETDMFSFGCVAFFIFTGDVPFKGILDGQLVIARYKGASPIQDGATYPNLDAGSALMEVLRACWNTDPQARPAIGEVCKLLNPTHPGSEPSAKPWACDDVGLSDGQASQPPTDSQVPPPLLVGCAFSECRVKRISKNCSMRMCPRHCIRSEAGCRVHTIGVVSVRPTRTTQSKRGRGGLDDELPAKQSRIFSEKERQSRGGGN